MRVEDVPGLFVDPRVLVVTAELTDTALDQLTPREAEAVLRAVPKRRREFATGRALARALLARHQLASSEILAGPDRAPIWPDGIAASISHSDTRAIVAMGRESEVGSVGLDIESGPELARELWAEVLVAGEIEVVERLGDEAAKRRHALLLFAAKEALYKAQYPVSQAFMGFDALRVDVEPETPSEGALVCTFRIAVPPFAEGTTARGRYRLGAFSSHDVVAAVAIRGPSGDVR